MNVRSPVDRAAMDAMRGAAAPPNQQVPNILEAVVGYHGLSPAVAESLGATVTRCLCGKCLGGVRVQFDTGFHLVRVGATGVGLEKMPVHGGAAAPREEKSDGSP